MILLPAALGIACGFALVRFLWGRNARCGSEFATQVFLAIGFGAGILSLDFFIVPGAGPRALVTIDTAIFIAFAVAGFVRRRRTDENGHVIRATSEVHPIWLVRALMAAFFIALAVGLYSAVVRTMAHPHGDGWDAFAIWNLHARFLFFGGRQWRDGFSSLIAWSHPDYPLLLPGVIAHLWTFLGYDSVAVPAVIALLFTFCTVGLLCSALFTMQSKTAGLLAGTVLLATPSFLEIGTWQYADVPLSFFILATTVLLSSSGNETADQAFGSCGLLTLGGLAASLAAWTKNEGLLFFCAILFARFLIGVRHREANKSRGSIWLFLAGSIPVLLVVVYFKHWIAPPNELFSQSNAALQKLTSPQRYWIACQWFGRDFVTFGDWLWFPLTVAMIVFGLLVGRNQESSRNVQVRIVRLGLFLTLAGYFVIYVVTPYDLEWHLRYSLNRLFLQLWPSAVFLFFLTCSGKVETSWVSPQD